MADYRGINTDPYSTIAGWEVSTDNGVTWVAATVLPTVADDVYANGFAKDIDVDSFASIYRTGTMVGVVQGGNFNLLGGITATGDRKVGGVGVCMTHSAATDSWAIGDTFGNAVGVALSHGTLCTGVGVLHSVGSSTRGSGSGSSATGGSDGIRSTGVGSFILYGDAIGNSGGLNGSAASNQGAGGLVMGRAIGGASNTARGAYGCTVNELESRNVECLVTGKFIMPSNMNPTWLNCFAKTGANVQIEIYDELGNAVLCNPLFAQGQASPADVRLNTAYANGALTGTAAIPPAASVALNVPVDATVGTAFLDADDLGQYITPQILSAITGLP